MCTSPSGSPGWGWVNAWVEATAITWFFESGLLWIGMEARQAKLYPAHVLSGLKKPNRAGA